MTCGGRAGEISPAGIAQLAGAVVLLGGAWPVTKVAINAGAAPLWFGLGRAALSGLAAFVLLGALGRLRWPLRADLPALLAVGVLQIAGFFALAHAAIAYVPAGRTAILSNTTTIFVVPLSLLVLHETIPPRRWLATLIGLAGIIVLVGPWAFDWHHAGVLAGNLFLLGAAGSWSLAIIAVRRYPPQSSMFALLPWCFAIASALLLPLAMAHGGVGRWTSAGLAALGFIGLIGGPIGTWCVMQAAMTLPSVVASVGFLATPAVGLLLSAAFLGEKLDADLASGAALILGGVLVAVWPGRGGRR
ncbi:MAG: DMT family transporter [Acidibrevibacterium sp.]|uniref:DMT family transporter n=1 Tax=Acidibrevibacterium sp. TaxID=2606776 RepID=UPI003CFF4D4E